MMKPMIFYAATFLLAMANLASANIIRCEISDRTHRLMPEWVEYELRERGTVVEVRDSVGAERGVDWVRGAVLESSTRRQTITWNVGMIPIGDEWNGMSAIINMRMTRLPNGSVQVIGVPTAVAYGRTTTYNGKARCSE